MLAILAQPRRANHFAVESIKAPAAQRYSDPQPRGKRVALCWGQKICSINEIVLNLSAQPWFEKMREA
jgi:hypothetical protein